jgi:hypothetical protein
MISEFKILWLTVSGNYKFPEVILSNETEKAGESILLISIFYFLVFATSIQTFSPFSQFPEWNTLLASRHLFTPLWSAKWIVYLEWSFAIKSVLLFYFVSSLLGIFLWQKLRGIRICVFLSIFFYLSLISSFGKIDHYLHVMVIVTFLLIFLPDEKRKRASFNRDILKVVFGIQVFILLTYFISGFFKFYGILDQELSGVPSALSYKSLAENIAKTSFATNSSTFFSSLILNNNSILFPFLLLFGYLIELLSLFIIIRPHWHRIWGLLLVTFHAFVLLTVGPDFTIQALVVGIFILHSPFSKNPLVQIREVLLRRTLRI